MNRAYRRSQLKQQRRKNKENKLFGKMCNDLSQRVYNCFTGEYIMPELLPCPFCGSTDLRYDGYWCTDFDGFYVRCLNCDSAGSPKGTKKAARKAWNTRTPNEKKEFKE